MQLTNGESHSIVKPKWFKIPTINGSKIIQFLKEAYRLDEYEPSRHQNSNMKFKNTGTPPSVGKKAS